MTKDDEFRLLVGGYFGVLEMDTYILKEYVLQSIEEYIKKFLQDNQVSFINIRSEAEKLSNELTLKRKLQDSLLVIRKVKAPFELEHMIKLRLEEMKQENR